MSSSSYDKLLDLLNINNPNTVRFDSSNISFSLPTEDIGNGWNTKITVNAIPNSKYVGSVDLFYHRIPLSDVGNNLWLFSDEPFTTESIVEILNSAKNTFLLVTDMDAIAIPEMRVGDIASVNLIAHRESLGWIGNVDVNLIVGFPSIASRLHTLVNTTLPGSEYLI